MHFGFQGDLQRQTLVCFLNFSSKFPNISLGLCLDHSFYCTHVEGFGDYFHCLGFLAIKELHSMILPPPCLGVDTADSHVFVDFLL